MGLTDDVGRGPVGLDTSVFIYFIEEHPRFLAILDPLFEAIDRGTVSAVTSALTLLEVLVLPYRIGNVPLAERYEALLTRSRGLRLMELNRPLLRSAAQLRAVHPGLRTPDAIQLAAGLSARCSAFVTADRDMPKLPGMRVIELAGYA